jgi:hypothetical protein
MMTAIVEVIRIHPDRCVRDLKKKKPKKIIQNHVDKKFEKKNDVDGIKGGS